MWPVRRIGGGDAAALFGAFIRFGRWRVPGGAALIGLGALFDGVGLLMLVPILGLVIGNAPAGRLLAPFARATQRLGQTERLTVLIAAFLLLMTLRALFLAWRDEVINRLQLDFVESLRVGLARRLAAARWRDVARISHARAVQTLSVEMHQIGIATNSALLATVALAMLAANAVLALVLAPLAGSLALAFLIAGALLSRPLLARARRLGRAITDAHFDMTDGALRFLDGLKIAMAQGLQHGFVAGYAGLSATARRDRLRFMRLQTGLRTVTAILAALVGAATLFLGLAVFHLAPAVLITLLVVLARMSGPAQAAQQGIQQILHSLPAFGMLRAIERELAAAPPPRVPARPAIAIPTGGGAITLDRVSFRHPGGHALLERASLTIPVGAFVAITGPSGSGKTSFLDLVTGLAAPDAGMIHVQGRPLIGPALVRHRAELAYVGQEPFLFGGTVRRNLAWSKADVSDEEIWAALALAGAANLLDAGAGLDTELGERGGRISVGERQRLALALALLRRPRLLILDEATNAIDIAGERPILARLALLRPRPTILMVAHRRESLWACDHRLTLPGAILTRVARDKTVALGAFGPESEILNRAVLWGH